MKRLLFAISTAIFFITFTSCKNNNIEVNEEPSLVLIDTLLDFTDADEVNNCVEFSDLLIDKSLEYYYNGSLFPDKDGLVSFNSDNTITNIEGDLFGDLWLALTLDSNDTTFVFCNVIELTIRNQNSNELVKDTLTFKRMTIDATGAESRDTSIQFILFREEI
jgi:hypothetical protein